MDKTIPVALFAYNRPNLLQRMLACLRENRVPLIYAFSDGASAQQDAPSVENVRRILRAINWAQVVLVEREENLGLGLSIRSGVTQVLAQHNSTLVFEDDLICVPGTYTYLCAALNHYRDEPRVMSVTGWTHPRVTPKDVTDQPYFDGRAECLVWGTWERAWQGMEQDALALMRECQAHGTDVYRYGADLPEMAYVEHRRNIWAVRWLYLHMLRGGLCLRPPHSMVEHVGSDSRATNSAEWANSGWLNPPLRACPSLPQRWIAPEENPQCPALWQAAYGAKPTRAQRLAQQMHRNVGNLIRYIGLRS